MSVLKKFSALFLILFTTSCVETVIVGSAAGGYLATREKGLVDTKNDVLIASDLGSSFIAQGLKNPGNSVDITVNEGRVLLTGIVRDAQKAQLATQLAWKVKGVKEVIDEIQLRDGDSIHPKDVGVSFSDYFLTLEIETKLLFTRNVSSVNYKITTVGKTVYVLGIAENEGEKDRVLNAIAKVRGVKKVVNHVILANDHRRNG